MEFTDLHSAADLVLSKAQMRFAREHRARPGRATAGHGRVLFYREDEGGTTRWLVSVEGEILDSDFIKHSEARQQLRDATSARRREL